MNTVVVWYMVMSLNHGAVVIPEPFVNEKTCKAEAARINRPVGAGGLLSAYAYCVALEKELKK